MDESETSRFKTESITGPGWLAIGLVLVTGLIHVYAGIVEGRLPVTLAGIGFFGAVVLYLVDYRRRLLYLVGAIYTAVQIPIWYVVKAGEYTTLGYLDKAIQVVLVVLLLYLYWQTRPGSDEHTAASSTKPTS
jgi:hypothetical protein